MLSRGHRAEHGNAVAEPVARDIGIKLRGGIAGRACDRRQSSDCHGRSVSVASAAISTSKPLRGTTAPTDSSRTTPSRLPGADGTGSVPGLATVMRSAGTP